MSQRFRRLFDFATSRVFVRSAFLVFFVGICVQLMLFVRWAKGEDTFVPRPEAVAGLLPIGHFTSFFAWVRGGDWDTMLRRRARSSGTTRSASAATSSPSCATRS